MIPATITVRLSDLQRLVNAAREVVFETNLPQTDPKIRELDKASEVIGDMLPGRKG